MADRLELRFELPQDLGSVEVPALLLQPLVENGIKHGLEPAVRGGCLTIGAARDGDELVLRVRDTGVGLGVGLGDGMDRGPRSPGASGGGFGLQQVRERLATLYGAQASLRLEAATDADGGTLATIRLPLTGFLPLMAPEQS
jgi:LytS/YehU family sensor histidine kinase